MDALSHMSVMFSRPRFRGKLNFHVEGAALVAQIVMNLPEMQETRIQSLGRDPLGNKMANHSSTLVSC